MNLSTAAFVNQLEQKKIKHNMTILSNKETFLKESKVIKDAKKYNEEFSRKVF